MRTLLLALVIGAPLYAADAQKLALESAADADFARIAAGTAADLPSATKCVQSQAMFAAIAPPEQVAEITFRKAYCQLAAAAATGDRPSFEKAANTFDDAIADEQSAAPKQKIPEPVPAAWPILAAVARLNAGAPGESQEKALLAAVDAANSAPGCGANTQGFCHRVQQLGNAWLGRIALERGDLQAAARLFANANAPEWSAWTAGRLAHNAGNFRQAAGDYGRAIGMWRRAPPDSVDGRLSPRPAMSEMLTDWGGARLASGDAGGALVNLDEAIKLDGENALAHYLRGVARQRLGRDDAATEDFDVASRAALAQGDASAAAAAHFYRGIVYYRRKEFARAEQEFSSALNADVAADWRADARAWRLLSAVAGGACGSSRENLSRAEASASPYFPKRQADSAMAACPITAAGLPPR